MSERRLGVVLVHGIRSGPAMWDPLRQLIAADPALGFVETLAFRYATGLRRFTPTRTFPSFDIAADSLREYIDTRTEALPRLMVIAHSQGGLIVQRYLTRMLTDGRGRDLARIGRIVLLACPNDGSEILMSLRRAFLGSRHPQESRLRPLVPEIKYTQRIVLRDVVNAHEITARTCPIPFSVYAGTSDNIVTAASAQSVFPEATSLDGDHSSIARPDSPEHQTYVSLRRLILKTADTGTDPPSAPGSLPAAAIRDVDRDATALGVHRAIDTAAPHTGLAPQPPYVLREHDRALRAVVSEAAAGRGRLAVLIGGSSTGKTRACFEALALLGPEWRLWHPPSAEDLVAGLAARPVIPRTVLWLNETQRYLTPSADDPAARALQELLGAPGRGPVLILGTLWPERHKELTGPRDTPAAQLLKDREIHLTDTGFRSASEAEVAAAVRSDPRLAEAFGADRAQATQYLAGGRELVARYQGGTETRALVDAAVDAARLGHAHDVTEPFLAAAARALLPEPYLRMQGPDWRDTWFRRALDDAGAPCRGVPGPLTTLGTSTGTGTGTSTSTDSGGSPGDVPTYQLADYLNQRISLNRALTCPPEGWWEAAVQHVPAPHRLLDLAEAARSRARYRVSARLARQALDAGPSVRAYSLLTGLHQGAGHADAADDAAQRALDLGHRRPALKLARLLRADGDLARSIEWLRKVADTADDDDQVRWELSLTLLEHGDVERALHTAEGLQSWELEHFADKLGAKEQSERRLSFARRLAAAGNSGALVAEAKRLAAEGRIPEAIALLSEPERLHSALAYEYLTDLREEAGDARGAEAAGRRAAVEHRYGKALKRLANRRDEAGDTAGSARALLALGSCPGWEGWSLAAASLFWAAGDHGAAAAAAEKAIVGGWPVGWVLLAHIADDVGDASRKAQALAEATATEDGDVWRALGDFYAEQDLPEEAAAAYGRAVALGEHAARGDLASLWQDAKDPARRDQAIAEALEEGHAEDLRRLPGHYADAGEHAAAQAQALLAAEHGDTGTGLFLVRRLLREGHTAEALDLAKGLARAGDRQALRELADALWEAEDPAGVIDTVEADWSVGDPQVPETVGNLLAAYAQTGAAAEFERTLSAVSSAPALIRAGELCEERGLRAAAEAAYERARACGDGRALLGLARLHADDPSAVRSLLHQAVDSGTRGAPDLLAAHYAAIGDRAAARSVRRYGVTDGERPAGPW
ncbi:hypothetical protein ABZ953_33355 [Streptomyces sp. NPDC046465]|uniref:hypothetical protein n=1 Tax=Streptomyces sp. NPDC046465 TaxID=3155810 RepID=UPI0033E43D55